jgi:hypothetical protein
VPLPLQLLVSQHELQVLFKLLLMALDQLMLELLSLLRAYFIQLRGQYVAAALS